MYYTLETGEPTCSSGRQLDWFIGSPAFVSNVEVWVDTEGARTHRAVFCRVLLELDGDLGSRARRPQSFRGLTREESRKAPRDEDVESLPNVYICLDNANQSNAKRIKSNSFTTIYFQYIT